MEVKVIKSPIYTPNSRLKFTARMTDGNTYVVGFNLEAIGATESEAVENLKRRMVAQIAKLNEFLECIDGRGKPKIEEMSKSEIIRV